MEKLGYYASIKDGKSLFVSLPNSDTEGQIKTMVVDEEWVEDYDDLDDLFKEEGKETKRKCKTFELQKILYSKGYVDVIMNDIRDNKLLGPDYYILVDKDTRETVARATSYIKRDEIAIYIYHKNKIKVTKLFKKDIFDSLSDKIREFYSHHSGLVLKKS